MHTSSLSAVLPQAVLYCKFLKLAHTSRFFLGSWDVTIKNKFNPFGFSVPSECVLLGVTYTVDVLYCVSMLCV